MPLRLRLASASFHFFALLRTSAVPLSACVHHYHNQTVEAAWATKAMLLRRYAASNAMEPPALPSPACFCFRPASLLVPWCADVDAGAGTGAGAGAGAVTHGPRLHVHDPT